MNAIRPHAFLHRDWDHSAYDIPEKKLSNMIVNHIRTAKDSKSEFSSWGASFEVVLWFRKFWKHEDESTLHLAVVDTHQIDNDVFHVHQLWRAGLTRHYNSNENTAEYLIHGVVEGPGYYCRPLDELNQAARNILFAKAKSADEKLQFDKLDIFGSW